MSEGRGRGGVGGRGRDYHFIESDLRALYTNVVTGGEGRRGRDTAGIVEERRTALTTGGASSKI